MEYASGLLERADPECIAYLEDEQSFDRIVEHWRSLLTIGTDDTPAKLIRLGRFLNHKDEDE